MFGIPRERADHAVGVFPGDLDEGVGDAAVAGEEGLGHAHGPHLVEDPGPLDVIAPVNDGVEIFLFEALELEGEIVGADGVGHLDDDRPAEPPAAVVDLADAEAAVAIAGPDDADALEIELAVEVIDEQIGHLAVVADGADDPGDVGFDEGRVGVAGVDHRGFRP